MVLLSWVRFPCPLYLPVPYSSSSPKTGNTLNALLLNQHTLSSVSTTIPIISFKQIYFLILAYTQELLLWLQKLRIGLIRITNGNRYPFLVLPHTYLYLFIIEDWFVCWQFSRILSCWVEYIRGIRSFTLRLRSQPLLQPNIFYALMLTWNMTPLFLPSNSINMIPFSYTILSPF